MPFDKNTPVDQGDGPLCGAACAVYVLHWLKDVATEEVADDGGGMPANELRRAMDATRFVNCTDQLGSTPANIAAYIKAHHPAARIYAPSEMLTNWSGRPWYSVLRMGLQASCSLNWCFGSTCVMPGGVLGTDYMIISMVSKSWTCSLGDYFGSHFVVQIGDGQIMDPWGYIRQANHYLTGGAFSRGWKSIGLDLYVYKDAAAEVAV